VHLARTGVVADIGVGVLANLAAHVLDDVDWSNLHIFFLSSPLARSFVFRGGGSGDNS